MHLDRWIFQRPESTKALRSLVVTAAAAMALGAQAAVAQQWTAVPLVSASAIANGETGGEGCQVIRGISCDSTGNILAMITDVGGMYKSTNGGASWLPMNGTFMPRGGNIVAIDPNNSNVMIADGQGGQAWDGLWRSTNQGDTWTSVLPESDNEAETGANVLVFDPSSVSGGASQKVYWSTPGGVAGSASGIWESTNNGANWSQISTSYGGAYLAVHPTNGTLYVGSNNLYAYSGGTFSTILSGQSYGVATTASNPNDIYALRSFEVDFSSNGGQTWTKMAGNGLPTSAWAGGQGPVDIKVSPANPNLLSINFDTGDWAQQIHYYSTDGGNDWYTPSTNLPAAGNPFNSSVAWHWGSFTGEGTTTCFDPANANIAWDDGTGQIVKSTDGCNSFQWANNGYNGVDCGVTGIGGAVTFNVSNPNLCLVATQDYDLAMTTNGGASWTNLDPAGLGAWVGGNGYVYGAYAFDSQHLFCGVASSWSATRYIYTSTDGGNTWTNTGNAKDYYAKEVGYGDPNNSSVGFYGNWRTADEGQTWATMTGCQGVLTSNPTGAHELYGCNGTSVVKSTDDGVTWTTVCTFGGSWLTDVAYDWQNNKVYACLDTRGVWAYNINTGTYDEVDTRLPIDNDGNRCGLSVTCDPTNPDIVYVGNHADIYCSTVGVSRSTDAGQTWQSLNVTNNASPGGGQEPASIRVNPNTRALWSFGECYGIWTYPAPASSSSITLTATPGNGQAALSWNAYPGAASYRVKISTTNGSGYSWVVTGWGSTSFTDTGLTDGTTYYFVVAALDGSGNELANSNQAAVTPVAPFTLTATPGDTTASLSWTGYPGAASYRVKVSTTNGSGYSWVVTGWGSTSFTDTGLTDGTTYYFLVAALDGSGNELANTNQAAVTPVDPPLAPTFSLAAGTYAGTQSVTISDGSSGVTIYYTTNGTTPTTSSTKYTGAISVSASETIKATATKAGEANSPVTTAAYTITAPAAPTGLAATAGASGTKKITIAWTASKGATGYTVYRSTSSGGTYTSVGTSTTASYANTGLTAGTTYYYKVAATNAVGSSSQAGPVSAKAQ